MLVWIRKDILAALKCASSSSPTENKKKNPAHSVKNLKNDACGPLAPCDPRPLCHTNTTLSASPPMQARSLSTCPLAACSYRSHWEHSFSQQPGFLGFYIFQQVTSKHPSVLANGPVFKQFMQKSEITILWGNISLDFHVVLKCKQAQKPAEALNSFRHANYQIVIKACVTACHLYWQQHWHLNLISRKWVNRKTGWVD